jgi:hypothetical protein
MFFLCFQPFVGGEGEAKAEETRREGEEARHRGSEEMVLRKIWLIRSKEALVGSLYRCEGEDSDGDRGGRKRQVPTVNPFTGER